MKNIFCCSGFEHRIADAGKRGIAILVWKPSEGIRFLLQSRGIGFEDESKIRPVPLDLNINISCEVGLRFCLFCGTELQKLVKAAPEEFELLAKKHIPYISADFGGKNAIS